MRPGASAEAAAGERRTAAHGPAVAVASAAPYASLLLCLTPLLGPPDARADRPPAHVNGPIAQAERPIAQADRAPAQGDGPIVHCDAPQAAGEQRACDALEVGLPQWMPDYPAQALLRCIRGWVDVEVTVDGAGHVLGVRIAASDPPGVFDDAALAAVKSKAAEPTAGNPVAVKPKSAEPTVKLPPAAKPTEQTPKPITASLPDDASKTPTSPRRGERYELTRRLAFDPLQCAEPERPQRRLE